MSIDENVKEEKRDLYNKGHLIPPRYGRAYALGYDTQGKPQKFVVAPYPGSFLLGQIHAMETPKALELCDLLRFVLAHYTNSPEFIQEVEQASRPPRGRERHIFARTQILRVPSGDPDRDYVLLGITGSPREALVVLRAKLENGLAEIIASYSPLAMSQQKSF